MAPVNLQKSNPERFAQVAHDKRATGTICSFHKRIGLSLTKNKQFAQKTDEQSPNPAIFLSDLFLCARISWIVCMYKCYWQTYDRSKGWVGAPSVCKLGKFFKMSFAWSYTTELEDAGFEPGRAPDSTSRCATNLLPHYKLITIVINAVGLIILRTFQFFLSSIFSFFPAFFAVFPSLLCLQYTVFEPTLRRGEWWRGGWQQSLSNPHCWPE